MALVIKLKFLGIREEISISNKQLLEYINDQDYGTKLDFATGIDIGTTKVSEQMTMLASFTNGLMKENLNPAQHNALKKFLKNKLKELS